MISAVTIWRYSLPFKRPITTKHGKLLSRHCLFIQWHYSNEGHSCVEWSEVCPLPGFSTETIQEAESQLIDMFNAGFHHTLNSPALGNPERKLSAQLCPSVRFGLEMGLRKLFSPIPADNNQLAIAGLMNGDESSAPISEHFSTFKIKLGRCDIDTDIKQVNNAIKMCESSTRFRLDANQSWTLAQARYFFSKVPHEQIEFIEEPLRHPFDYSSWLRSIPVGFAFDEQTQQNTYCVEQVKGLSALVLKPMLIGLNRTIEIINKAEKLNITTVISSSFESSLTLNFLYQLASAYTPTACPGLDTFHSHKQDIIEHLALPVQRTSTPLITESNFQKVAHYEC